MDLRHRQVVVVGLGKSGVAAARFLVRHEAQVIVTDRAPAESLAAPIAALKGLDVELKLGGHDSKDFSKADLVVLSPGVPHTMPVFEPAWARGIPVIGEMELASRFVREPILAVTGTNGKTTTKDLLAALCAAAAPTHATAGNYNNDLGLPLTLLGLRRDHDLAVVELGASRAGDIDRLAALASPQVGVITNASEAHLSSFGSLAEIVSTKGELLDHLPPDGAAVLNADSPGFADWRARAACRVISCGHEAGDHRWSWRATDGGGALTLDGRTHAVPLPGRHNGANLAAALLAAEALLGAERFDGELDVADALSHYAASPHRSRVLRRGGVTVLDDTYNANPASLLTAAVAAAQLTGDGRVIAVLGAMAELGPRSDDLHEAAGRRLHEAGVDLLLAVGGAAAPLADGFAAAGGAAERCEDQRTAARVLAELVREGDRVLFKGSRSSAMEEALEAFLKRLAPDLGDLERT